MHVRSVALIIAFAFLTGCAATVKKGSLDATPLRVPAASSSKLVLNLSGADISTSAKDWEGFKEEWQEDFLEQTRLAGIAFELQSGQARPTGEEGSLLSVYVDDYRFIRPGSRYAVGIMTGHAYIQSKISFADLKTGERFGEQNYNTTSSAWEGIFSAMTNKQVEAIAVDVVRQVKGR